MYRESVIRLRPSPQSGAVTGAGADAPIFSSYRHRPGSGGVMCDRGIPRFRGMTT